MTWMVQCDKCKKPFTLNFKDRRDSDHVNCVSLQDKDIVEAFYERSYLMLCPECLKELKTFLNIEK